MRHLFVFLVAWFSNLVASVRRKLTGTSITKSEAADVINQLRQQPRSLPSNKRLLSEGFVGTPPPKKEQL